MRAVADFTAAGVFFGEIKLKARRERKVERMWLILMSKMRLL